MAKYKVLMLAFMDGEEREVVVERPDHRYAAPETMLEAIFHWGQNDFQPVEGRPSVSVGDVICLEDKFYIVQPVGFAELSAGELETYKKIPRLERSFSRFARGDE